MSEEMDRVLEVLAAAPSNDGEPVEKRREDMDADGQQVGAFLRRHLVG